MHDSNATPLAWSIDSACHRAGIGRTKIYALIKDGELRPIKIGRRTLIPESELQKFILRKIQEA
jgi:excisionase family DNA binding protein